MIKELGFVVLLAVVVTVGRCSPEERCYFVYKTNKTCLLMNANITINLYNQTGSNHKCNNNFSTPINCTTLSVVKYMSHCNSSSIKAVFTWGEEQEFMITLQLSTKEHSQWELDRITLGVNISDDTDFNFNPYKEGHVEGYVDVAHEFGHIDYNKYFLCNKEFCFDMTMNTNGTDNVSAFYKMFMAIKDLKIQAFKFTNGSDYDSKASSCYQDHPLDHKFVPIVIGSTIGGLVLVVLIAYIVGRLRNKKNTKAEYEPLN